MEKIWDDFITKPKQGIQSRVMFSLLMNVLLYFREDEEMVSMVINSCGNKLVPKKSIYSKFTWVLSKEGKNKKLVKNGHKLELFPSSNQNSLLKKFNLNKIPIWIKNVKSDCSDIVNVKIDIIHNSVLTIFIQCMFDYTMCVWLYVQSNQCRIN